MQVQLLIDASDCVSTLIKTKARTRIVSYTYTNRSLKHGAPDAGYSKPDLVVSVRSKHGHTCLEHAVQSAGYSDQVLTATVMHALLDH